MKSTLIKDLYGEIERLKSGNLPLSLVRYACVCHFFKLIHSRIILTTTLSRIEVYAAREKNGVYIPKERYYQEETERKVLIHKLCFLFIS